ncbi:MAG: phosphoribosylanthranilate isomerase [Bacteroidetes bacterium]|nr:MAG: phosphoribosylanthranilate isomerase [Bacteroidota bacterium]
MKRVKVCGLKEPPNLVEVSRLGVDFLGFIFYPPSPRCMVLERLPETTRQALEPLPVERVGVFVNARIPEVLEKIAPFQLNCVQLHGEESPEYCAELKRVWPPLKIIKAFRIDASFDFSLTKPYETHCTLFLFDTRSKAYGGSGRTFDWALLENYRGQTPFLLSGGLGPENLEALKNFHHPRLAGYDLNSRFETEPGIKDVPRLERFLKELLSS